MSGLRALFRGNAAGRREALAPLGEDDDSTPESDRSHERELIENISKFAINRSPS